MYKTTNTDNLNKLIYDYLTSAYGVIQNYQKQDTIYRRENKVKIECEELMKELRLVFCEPETKLFFLFNRWCRKNFPDAVLFDYWKRKKTSVDKIHDYLPDFLHQPSRKHLNYEELYEEFYFGSLDY